MFPLVAKWRDLSRSPVVNFLLRLGRGRLCASVSSFGLVASEPEFFPVENG